MLCKNYKNNYLINNKKSVKKNETNIIKFIKTKTKNGIKEEKTYIIENKDINIFNIDINKNNNSMICYNIDNINNTHYNKDNINENNSFKKEKINGIIKNSLKKYKKPIAMINNFTNYKKKNT